MLYIVDWGYPAVVAALLYGALAGRPFIVEIGDPLGDLLWSTGRVGRAGRLLIHQYERTVLKRAAHVVVRGRGLKRYAEDLGARAVTVVPDGVDGAVFRPLGANLVSALRTALRLDGSFVVGVMGTLGWSKRLRWGYGLELLQALASLRDTHVAGLVVGDGPGRRILERVAMELGVSERVRFVGHIRFEDLPPYINLMDVCLSTQTNDSIGRGRTTAKLPLLLACGRFILASRVGEAAEVLPEEMLIDYEDGFDRGYPVRLAERIRDVVANPALMRVAERSRAISETLYDYRTLVPRVSSIIDAVLTRPRSP